jgi:hypothetical protein
VSKGSAPAAPDPYTTAQAQYQYGTEAADYNTSLNDVNTVGPTGTTGYQITGYDPKTGAPIRTQTTTLSPTEQGILNSTENLQQGSVNEGSNLLSQFDKTATGVPTINPVQYAAGSTLPIANQINASGVAPIADVSGLEQYGQNTALAGEEAAANPALTQNREQLDASLRNSGAQPGTPAYDNAMAALDASQTAQRTQMAGAAITAGTGLENTVYGESANTNQQEFSQAQAQQAAANAAQSQQFGESATNVGLNNSAGAQSLQDYATATGIPLNELSSILGGAQVTTPTASSAAQGSVSTPDIMSAFQNQYSGALANYNAGVQSSDTTESTVGTIAAAALIYA